jgi:hypothetical protein
MQNVSNLFPIDLSLVQIKYRYIMPTTKLLLQEPFQPLTEKEKQLKKQKKPVKRTLNDRETRLYLFLILDREHKVKIKTEHVIYPAQWEFRTQKKKELKGNEAGTPEKNKEIKIFNARLDKLKDDILAKYDQLKENDPDMPFSQIAEALKDYGKTKEIPFPDTNKSFSEVLDDYLAYLEGAVAPGTVKKFNTLKKSLEEFGTANRKYQTLSFSLIDHNFKDSFIAHLRSQKPRGRQKTRPEGFRDGLLNDSIGKYLENLKTFLKWSEERGYNHNDTYKKFSNFTSADKKRKKQDHDIVTLTLNELKQFYAYDFKNRQSLARVRDLFCFAAFTVQRWSDIDRFDKSQISGDVWTFEAYKTKKVTEIDLLGYASGAADILKKYEFVLPKISLTKFNLFIKEAARVAGITENVKIRRYVGARMIEISKPKCEFIGSHTARKTGVSILLNDYNVPITHVLRITQHSDLKTLQKYINVDRTARRDAMSKTQPILEPLNVVQSQAV